jgi:hypothetical protein
VATGTRFALQAGMSRFTTAVLSLLVVALLAVAACGGGGGGNGGGNPNQPTPPPSGTPGIGATITIRPDGAIDQPDVRIEVGQSVTFVNSHNRMHEINSNPHEVHNECPPINAFGRQNPGGSVTVGPFTQRGTCGYHDHNEHTNRALWGQIRVGVDEPGPAPNYIRP